MWPIIAERVLISMPFSSAIVAKVWRSWGRFRAPPGADESRKKERRNVAIDKRASERSQSLSCNRRRATFGSMQALSCREFSKTLKTLVNTDFFGHYSFQKNTNKMF